MSRLFALIDRLGISPLLAVLGFLVVTMGVVVYFNDRDNEAKHAATVAELGRKCVAAGYTPAQCEFILVLSERHGLLQTGCDAATMAAIQAATH